MRSSNPPDKKFRPNQRTFTTGDVAYLLDVTIHTASNMMYNPEDNPELSSSGKLQCFKLPGGGYRRVARNHLVEYLRRIGLTDSLKEIGEPLEPKVSSEPDGEDIDERNSD